MYMNDITLLAFRVLSSRYQSNMVSSDYTKSQVAIFFEALGMSKFTYRFLEEGFDTVETLYDI